MTQKNTSMKANGMIDQKSTVKTASRVVLGDWSNDTVRLDFDDTSLDEVKLWAYRALKWFKLEGFLILESSMKNYIVKQKGKIFYRFRKGSYLVIFNRPVGWSLNVRIMNWVALESGSLNLQRYVCMQCIKETSTARISRKGKKPAPKVVFRYGLQDKQVKNFLETRKLLPSFLRGR